jgi:hypothetical protein
MTNDTDPYEDFDHISSLNTDLAVWQGVQNWRIVLEVDAPPPNIVGLDVKWPCAIGCSDRCVRMHLDIDMLPFGGETHGVSRRHAALLPHGTGLMIMDIGSTNGTWVNENRLTPGQQYPLEKGDQIEFGTLKATIRSISRLEESQATGYSTRVMRPGVK